MLLALAVGGEAPAAPQAASAPAWHARTPYREAIGAVQAILPLVLFLWLVRRVLLRRRAKEGTFLGYGVAMALGGMLLFNLGLSYGLAPLGVQAGTLAPAAFAPIPESGGSPFYPPQAGLALVLAFGVLLGLGATLAEPALIAMGHAVEDLTDGAFRRALLVHTVAVGVALGTGAGIAKIVFDIPLAMLLLPAYGVALAMTLVSREEYVNLAWDSAGVTTGPVTVPLVLALGLGLGKALGAAEGFGVLALASVGPIVSVLAVGLWIRLNERLASARAAHREEA
jgi:hypothetical protein